MRMQQIRFNCRKYEKILNKNDSLYVVFIVIYELFYLICCDLSENKRLCKFMPQLILISLKVAPFHCCSTGIPQ